MAGPAKSPERRYQVAALPIRKNGDRLETCLVTTRTTRRWTVPKGWPMKGRTDSEAARIEAEQEAGLVGKIGKKPMGTYVYWKRLEAHFELIETRLYLLRVKETLSAWKEQGERYVQWMSLEEAILLVDEPGLAALLRAFADRH
ncbi:NUDIX hydrolase [Labrys miyagiensis]